MLKRAVTLFLSLTLWLPAVSARFQDGMRFRSYEVPSEERTSLTLPSGPGEWITFHDSLTVSFSVKIELEKGFFGYICRMVLDDLLPVDVLLSPQDGAPVISATADHQKMVSLYTDRTDIEGWKDIYIRCMEEEGNLLLSAGGQEVLRIPCKVNRHRVRLYFGKADAPGCITSDVAPMILADLQVRMDARPGIVWMLSGQEDLVPRRGIGIKAVNPVFMRDFNRTWTLLASLEVPSVTYAALKRDGTGVYFVSDGQVAEVDVHSGRSAVHPFSRHLRPSISLDRFETLPDGTLVYADPERSRFIRWDTSAAEWEADDDRTRISTYLHNNSVYLEDEGRFLEMFGYGQHRYSNIVRSWTPDSLRVSASVLEGVRPRYLAGAGVFDGKVYVLGGKGNDAGQQELGVSFYDEMVEIDPSSLSSRLLWRNSLLRENVPSADLVFEEDGIYTLLYDPEVHESSLRLYRFAADDGASTPLADPIPYAFTDVTSQVRLGYDGKDDVFVATVCSRGNDGIFHADVYVLGYPVLSDVSSEGYTPVWLYVLIAALAAFAVVAAWVLVRRQPARQEPASGEDIPSPQAVPVKPGVYLLGAFHVIDREGNDISQSFSPILVQLLSILAVYTADKGGVSNAQLKSILWPDKSDESFNNNKGVNLRRVRDLLSQVGNVSVVQDGGLWKIDEGASLCDYIVAGRILSGEDEDEILGIASRGALLPEYPFDWLDPFKSAYTDLVLQRLQHLADAGVSAEKAVRIADCRLRFDSLDEEAVLLKCRSLVELRRVGSSKAEFERFKEEYNRVMGEPFEEDFTSFLKKNLH